MRIEPRGDGAVGAGVPGKNDPKAASIQLKNALQENPGLAEARFLLGRVHLDQGDVPSALKELKRASELGYSADQVTPLLARAMVMGGEGKEMIEQFANTSLGDPASQAQLQATLGEAYLGTGLPTRPKSASATQRGTRVPGIAPSWVLHA